MADQLAQPNAAMRGQAYRRAAHYMTRASEAWQEYLATLPEEVRRQLTEPEVEQARSAGKVKQCRRVKGPEEDWEW